MSGKIIVFEGPDGVGKSTIASAVVEKYAEKLGVDISLSYVDGQIFGNIITDKFVYLSFPGKDVVGSFGSMTYQLHHNIEQLGYDWADFPSECLQIMHFASHVDLIKSHIVPILKNDGIVILDRSWVSLYVYGEVNDVDISLLNLLVEYELGLLPDCNRKYFLLTRHSDLMEHMHEDHSQLVSQYYKFFGALGDRHRLGSFTYHHIKNNSDLSHVVYHVSALLGIV